MRVEVQPHRMRPGTNVLAQLDDLDAFGFCT